jgi:hypothetical protein
VVLVMVLDQKGENLLIVDDDGVIPNVQV